MAHHHKLDCLVKILNCFVVIKVKSQERFTIPVNVYLEDSSSSGKSFCHETWNVMQEDWFAVFKFEVTMRDQIIKYDFLPYLLNCRGSLLVRAPDS